jgi:hypothetical protein
VAVVAVVAVVVLGVAAAGALTGSATPTSALAAPRFVDEAEAAGVVHAYDGEFDYFVGGGVAAFDCDDDLRPDLYLAGGANPAALFRNESPVGGPLRFTPLPDPVTDLAEVTGAYPVDIDSDGQTDLAVLRRHGSTILRGLGDCRFEPADEALGLDGGDGWTTGFSATWETPDATLPTLAFAQYLATTAAEGGTSCAHNRIVRPDASGSRYAEPIPLTPGWCALSALFSDWDRSGRRDLRISNDRHYYRDGQEELWRVEPGEAPRRYTEADGWQRLRLFGMGIASQDLTGDGLPEVYLTSQGDNKLQTLADGPDRPTYEDIALERGVTAHRPYTGDDLLPSTAWHPAFEDVNDDGFFDLFVTKGNVEAQTDYAMEDPSDLFIGQPDGTFRQSGVEAGLDDVARSRGAAIVDFDGDGLLDIVKVTRRENVRLYRNVGGGTAEAPEPMGHWLAVQPRQDGPNRDAIGGFVAVRLGDRVIERELTVGGGHVSGQLVPVHFGLGPAERAEVRVTWPDGDVGPWMPIEADQVVRITRGAAEPEPLARPGDGR